MVPSAPASTSAFVSGGINSESMYSGLPSGSFVPRRPSRPNPRPSLLGPPMSTHLSLNAALFALISAIACCTAARFFSTFSFATGTPPCARLGTEKGSAFRMTTPPCWMPLVPPVEVGVPNRSSFAVGLSIRPNHGPRLKPTGISPTSSNWASMPNCLNCHTAHCVASV